MKADKAKNLIAYDYLQVHGGAEIVTKEILHGLEFDELLTSFASKDVVSSLDLPSDKIHTLGSMTDSTSKAMIFSFFRFLKFKPKEEYNTVIISGIFAPLIARNVKAKKIIYYCHTPPRFLYDLKEHYRKTLSLPSRLLLKAFALFYKPFYESSFKYIDHVFANSNNVKKRLKQYINIESEILYPPCDTSYEGKESKGYFLSTARVEPLKRVDLIVEAFMQMPDKKLIVMSGGSQLEELKERAKSHSNIRFSGWVSEEQKRELIAHCEATIYIPKDEDFGMSPVESISAGKPVIGVSEGGLLETVKHLKEGYLLPPKDISQQLLKTLKKTSLVCIKTNSSYKFSKSNFLTVILTESKVKPPL